MLATLPLIQRAGAGWVRINFRLGNCYRDWTSRGCDGRTALAAYDDVVGAAGRRGLRVLGLISNVTEFGWQTHALSPALQAANIETAYAIFQATPYVAQAYWYAVQDVPAAAGYYGLAREDGTCKPAFAAYQACAGYPPARRRAQWPGAGQ